MLFVNFLTLLLRFRVFSSSAPANVRRTSSSHDVYNRKLNLELDLESENKGKRIVGKAVIERARP